MKNNLRALMGEKGITSVDALMGLLPQDPGHKLSRATIFRILRGNEPSTRAALVLSGFFHRDVSEMFEFEKDGVSL